MSEIIQADQHRFSARRIKEVPRWLLEISPAQESYTNHGILAELYNSSRGLYQYLMRDVFSEETKSSSLYRQFQNGYTRYVIWAHDYGAHDGELDTRLQDSQRPYNLTLKVLIRIGSILQNIYSTHTTLKSDRKLQVLFQDISAVVDGGLYKFIHHFDHSDDESDMSDDDDLLINEEDPVADDEALRHAIEELLVEIGYLSDLGPILEEPVPDHPTEEPPPFKIDDTEGPTRYFVNRVLSRFPKCNHKLANTLGKANWSSTIRLLAKRKAALEPGPTNVDMDNPVGETPRFKDSALGSSLPTGFHTDPILHTSSYETTLISYCEDGTTRARIPPLPSDIDEGQFFPCITCGRNIEKRDIKSWKRHLLADLQPWVCCQTSCPCESTFMNREEWVAHLYRGQKDHPEWDEKTCPLCQTVITEGGRAALSHVARHLEEISLAAVPCYPKDDDDHDSYDDERTGSEISSSIIAASLKLFGFGHKPTKKSLTKTSPSTENIASKAEKEESQSKTGHISSTNAADEAVDDTAWMAMKPPCPNPRSARYWYCCSCNFGPMTVETTRDCVYCLQHRRCASCTQPIEI
ncbi:hypothetical protein F4774DRAFT_387977 [Daldinia eschscholtzii]|nr:hypothetical protein F4774DRAFT_387977 [Daldinia eschscholtzii]